GGGSGHAPAHRGADSLADRGAAAPPGEGLLVHAQFPEPPGRADAARGQTALVALLAQHRVPLIEDDVYAELYFTAKRPLPAKAYDREGWVMHCSSFSKSLAPGYRVGWVSGGRFAQQVERLKL